jgi:hypothetical protein
LFYFIACTLFKHTVPNKKIFKHCLIITFASTVKLLTQVFAVAEQKLYKNVCK